MPGAYFNVKLLIIYLQDEISLGSRLKISPGFFWTIHFYPGNLPLRRI
ncbi:MAG: hypothetical protein ABI045_02490 [Flavobacteriales bacterium]